MTLFSSFTAKDWLICGGNICMFACSVFYILWWVSANRTGTYHPDSAPLLFCTIGAGLVSVVLIFCGMNAMPAVKCAVPVWAVCASCAMLYAVLLPVSGAVFHRPATSELLIMVVWLTGELCVIDALNAEGRFGTAVSFALLALVALSFAAGYVCYLKYYHLEGRAMFIDGIIPLACDGAAVFIITAVQLLSAALRP